MWKPARRGQTKETMMSLETWEQVTVDLFEFERKAYLVTSNYYSDFFEFNHLRSPSKSMSLWSWRFILRATAYLITCNWSLITVRSLNHVTSKGSRRNETLNILRAAHITDRVTTKQRAQWRTTCKLLESAKEVYQIHFRPCSIIETLHFPVFKLQHKD